MANTYTQIYLHIVFAVYGRDTLIKSQYKEDLHKYITGIIQHRDHKLIAINSMPDHVHILIGYNPQMALSDLVRDIKAASSKFVNDSNWLKSKFSWQQGYGAFSYSRSQLDKVIHYIESQEEHHKKQSFNDEYKELLEKFQVEYDPKYIFQTTEE
jgi:putative transposase